MTESDTPNQARPLLDRVLNPKTIAMVGVSDTNRFAVNSRGTLDSDADVFLVNPRYETAFGRKLYPSLTAIGRPIDAVFSVMAAERTTDLIEEAAAVGAGGVITIAGGFAEVGTDGASLQERVKKAAWQAGMPIIGPNGVGYINVPRGLDLTMLPHFGRRAGNVSMIAHSGATIEAIGAAAWRAGGLGFNRLISAGNEPVTDMSDYLNYLVDDDDTEIIALVMEKIRRPDAFFEAAARARELGKPIIVVKLARTERTQRMAKSHTGTLVGDSWVYEQAFKQAGILRADEIDELVDRLQFLGQFPKQRWSPVNGLFVFTGTGGFAAMMGDLAEEEHVNVPEAPELSEWISSVVPGGTVPNPLDATGFMGTNPEIVDEVMARFMNDPQFDMHIFISQFADWDKGARFSAEGFAERAAAAGQPAILAPVGGNGGWWLDEVRAEHGTAIGNGPRGCLRGLNTMATYVRSRSNAAVRPATDVPALPVPATPLVAGAGMLPFKDTLALMESAGIRVARCTFVESGEAVSDVGFDGPYVVKLADVPHRSDIGAVRVGVQGADLADAVAAMRQLAAEHAASETVAVQEMVSGSSEAFIGIRGSSDLGPIVAFGLGGIFVEILGRVSGRLAPMTHDDARELIAEFDDTGVLKGRRGQRPWDLDQLADILVGAGQLAAGARGWLDTFDINPLLMGPNGIVAVDGLCLFRDHE